MLIVLDTNVLVSSLLKRDSPPAIILDAILEGKPRLAVDDRIFAEYREVLHRPRLKIHPSLALAILSFIRTSAFWVQCESVEFIPELIIDPGDIPFAEVAMTSHAEALITGNMKHFTFLVGTHIQILTPQEFLAKFHSLV